MMQNLIYNKGVVRNSLSLKISQLLQNGIVTAIIVALLYYVTARIGHTFAIKPGNVTPLWPPSGFALAALYCGRRGVLPGIFLGCFFSSVNFSIIPLPQAILLNAWISSAIVLTTLAGFNIIKRFCKDFYPFNTFQDVMIFVFGTGLVACCISSILGTTGLYFAQLISANQWIETWITWWLGDSVGVITLGTCLIVWLERHRWDLNIYKVLQSIALLLAILAIYNVMYVMHYKILYIILLVFILAAYSLETQLSLTLAMIFTTIIIYAHARDYTVFNNCPPNQCMMQLQLFICSIFITILVLSSLISERKRAFLKLKMLNTELENRIVERNEKNKSLQSEIKKSKALSEQLVEMAHKAGKSEIANSMLHNAGNVLNSVNVSILLLLEKVNQSKLSGLVKASDMLKDNVDNLHHFLTDDERGKYWPAYLFEVTNCLQQEHQEALVLLQTLKDRANHIRDIIKNQEAFSGKTLLEEKVLLSSICDEAIKLSDIENTDYGINLQRAYDDVAEIYMDKLKVLQILVNFLVNARDALQEKINDRQITFGFSSAHEGFFKIEVTDNGTGIPEDKLQKIFTYGFTTKKVGHGIGLHSSSNFAQEMGGKLEAKSHGVNKGATFTLYVKAIYFKE